MLKYKNTQLTALSIALSNLSPPTARPAPAPQSLRRLFHDESSTDPDPFQSFAHQQPPTPQTTEGSSTIKQTGRFPSPEHSDLPPLDDSSSPPQTPSKKNEFDGQTIRQARLGRDGRSPTPLMITTDYPPSSSNTPSAMPTATYHPVQTSQEPTPIARTDHTNTTTAAAAAAAVPSPRRIQNKMSLDNLSLTPTSKTQPAVEERSKSSGGMRRPSASDARDGLRGFQFPLMTKSGPGPSTTTASAASSSSTQAPSSDKLFPPSLNRNHSASPTFPFAEPLTTTTTTTTTSPTGTSSPGFGGIALGPRPPMMRQASVAVMEGRAASQSQSQAQAQALALALAQTQAQQLQQQHQQQQHQQQGPASPPTPKKTVALAVPSPIGLGRPGMSASTATAAGGGSGVGEGGQGMMIRSRSGSKAEDGHPVGLRDLLKVGSYLIFLFQNLNFTR